MLSTTDAAGFVTGFDYDVAGRLLATRRELWVRGTFEREVVTRQRYDLDGRLVAQIDDAGNLTTLTYDERSRLLATTLPDGAQYVSIYDAFSNIVTATDPNGNVVTNTYDSVGRRTRRASAPAPPSAGVPPDAFVYDGLGRLVKHGPESPSIGRHVVTEHDSLGNVLRETCHPAS